MTFSLKFSCTLRDFWLGLALASLLDLSLSLLTNMLRALLLLHLPLTLLLQGQLLLRCLCARQLNGASLNRLWHWWEQGCFLRSSRPLWLLLLWLLLVAIQGMQGLLAG